MSTLNSGEAALRCPEFGIGHEVFPDRRIGVRDLLSDLNIGKNLMKTTLGWVCFAVAAICFAPSFLPTVLAQPSGGSEELVTPSIKINGRGEVNAAPDLAVIRIGATAQAKDAAAAQKEVSEIVTRALKELTDLGIPRKAISTAGITLSPVYSRPTPRDQGQVEPRIVGFRASNVLSVQVAQLDQVGAVIDAGVRSGANEMHGLNFELRNDTEQRTQALRMAVQEARTKAEAIANGLNVRLGPLLEVIESAFAIAPPHMEMGRAMAMADAAGTPVEPGQIRVQASVQVRYRIEKE
jgi:uncharacterized protein